VLKVLAEEGLLKGNTVAIDGTTLEANAALRSIVRRDTGEAYDDFLKRLAKESGIETPTREQLAKLDRKRPKKGSNDDWENPHDPDARITKMKDGRTHLAHKAEHARGSGKRRAAGGDSAIGCRRRHENRARDAGAMRREHLCSRGGNQRRNGGGAGEPGRSSRTGAR
jgi:hypothetical protein